MNADADVTSDWAGGVSSSCSLRHAAATGLSAVSHRRPDAGQMTLLQRTHLNRINMRRSDFSQHRLQLSLRNNLEHFFSPSTHSAAADHGGKWMSYTLHLKLEFDSHQEDFLHKSDTCCQSWTPWGPRCRVIIVQTGGQTNRLWKWVYEF